MSLCIAAQIRAFNGGNNDIKRRFWLVCCYNFKGSTKAEKPTIVFAAGSAANTVAGMAIYTNSATARTPDNSLHFA